MANLEELLVRIDASTEGLRRELARTEKGVKQTTDVVEKSGKRIDAAFKKAGIAFATYFSARALKDFAQEAVNTSLKFDALQFSMLAASGSARQAEQNMAFLRAESERLGLNLLANGKSFARLTAAAKGTALEGQAVKEIFTGISTAATVLRFNTEDTDGALRAFEQMISKGKVSMEELRLQLGDRLPGALKLAAKAFGTDPLSFEKMVANGRVLSDDFLPKFAKVIQDEYIGGITEASESAQAELNRMTNAFNEMQDAIGSSITDSDSFAFSLDALSRIMEHVTDVIGHMKAAGGLLNYTMMNMAMSAYALGDAFGIISEQEAGEFIAKGLKLTNQEMGEFTKYLSEADQYMEKLKGSEKGFSVTDLSKDDSLAGLKERRDNLLDFVDTNEAAAKEVARLNVEIKKLTPSVKSGSDANAKAAKKLADYLNELNLTVEQTEMLNKANKVSEKSYEDLKIAFEAHNEARKNGLKVGTAEYENTVKLIKKREELKDEIKKTTEARKEALAEEERQQKEYADALNEPWQNAFENVQDSLADMLVQGRYSFESLADIGKQLAAEVAAAWIIRPALGEFINVSGGSGGGSLSGDLLSSGGSQLGDLLSLGGSLFSSGTGGGLASQALSVFDDAAASVFGTASSTAVGPFLPGQGTASSILGSTFAGSYGGAIASLLGLSTGNFAIDTGASLAGAALGNLALPGIGGVIGSFALPSVLGALGIGSKSRPHPAATAGVQGFSASGALRGVDLQAKHLSEEDARLFSESLNTVSMAIAGITGIDFSGFTAPEGGTAFQAGINDGQGFFTFGSHKSRADLDNKRVSVTFDPQDEEDMNRAMGDLAKLFVMRAQDIGQEIDETLIDVLDRIETEGRSLEEVLADIAFAMNYDSLGQYPQQLSEVAQVVETLRDQFDEAAETAERLGLAVDKVRQYEEIRMQQLLAGYAGGIAQTILGATSPGTLATMSEKSRYAEQIRDLKLLGATEKELQQAELLHKINMHNIEMQYSTDLLDVEQEKYNTATNTARRFESIQNSMENILHELTLGQYSPLDPVANLDEFRRRIQDLGGRARLGDADAAEELSQLLPEFVALSGEVNGFNAAFEADRQIAETIARDTLNTAVRQVSLQTSIANSSQQQIAVLQSGFTSLEQALETLGSKLTTGDIIDSAQGLTGLNDAQSWSTIWGREQGYLGQNETATGGLLASRLDSAGGDAWAARDAAFTAAGFATGGMVRGRSGHDVIRANLTDGEFVMRRSAVQSVGASNLAAMNNGGGGGTMSDIAKGLSRLAAATANGNDAMAKEIGMMRRSLDAIERNAKLVAAS